MSRILQGVYSLAGFHVSLNKLVMDFTSSELVLMRCLELGIVCGTMKCEACDSSMKIRKCKCIDGFQWECTVNSCRKRYSIRKYSIFEDSKLQMGMVLSILFNFSCRTRPDVTSKTFGVGLKTVQQLYRLFRQRIFFFYELEREFIQIGGQERTVEIDKCMLGRRKYNKGRMRKQLWVFGGIEREDKKNWFVEIVEKRNGNTLLPILEKKIKNGTAVMSDGWRAYRNLTESLPQKQFIHKWVNHDVEFVSSVDRNVHTQNIECFWSTLKRFLRCTGTNYRANLSHFIAEHYFRTKYSNNFYNFLLLIFKVQ